jgi:DUF4097 and DUF4098 domain-containing protein YvlB
MRRNIRISLTVPVLTLMLGIVSNSPLANTIEERFEKTVPLRSGGYFSLTNENGNVEVSSWDRDEVRIEALKRVQSSSRRDAREAMQELTIDIETRTSDEVVVETIYPRQYRHDDGLGGVLEAIFGGPRRPQLSVQYWITVPEKVDLKINTTNGRVDIENIEGHTRAGSTNGAIQISSVKGVLDVSTTNGRIEVNDVDGEVDASTTNGGIEVRFDSRANISKDMSVHTTNGSIEIELPEDVNADVNARTTNGHIDTDFPITVQGRYGRKDLSGQINNGGPLIDLKTTNGSIHILKGSRSRF